MPSVDTTLIIPAYNEEQRISAGFQRLAAAAESGRIDLTKLHILYVDDGSTDSTFSLAQEIARSLPHATVLKLQSNVGKGAAVTAGVRATTTARLIFTDTDFAIDPAQIPQLLAGLDDAPLAIGSRLDNGHIDYGSAVRTFAGRSFNRLIQLVTSVEVGDTQCGFKALTSAHAKILFHFITIHGFAFDVELLTRAQQLHWPITPVPVTWDDVKGSHVRLAQDSVAMLAELAAARTRRLPDLFGLALPGTTNLDDLRQACAGSTLLNAPLLQRDDGALLFLATLHNAHAAQTSLRAVLTAIGPQERQDVVRSVSLEDIAHYGVNAPKLLSEI